MKNVITKICIITVIATTGVMTACDKQGSDKKVTAKYRFTGTSSGSAKSTMSCAASRAVQGTEDFTEFYSKLGAKKGAFTPTEMVMAVGYLCIGQELGMGPSPRLINSVGNSIAEGIVMIDLAKPITVSADGIEPGFYDYLQFNFSDSYAEGDAANDWENLEWLTNISFPKPAGINLQTHAYSSIPSGSAGFGYLDKYPGNITVLLSHLQPVVVDYNWGYFTKDADLQKHLGTNVGGVHDLFFVGDKYIIAPCTPDWKYLSDFIPGSLQLGISGPTVAGVIIPFEGIDVPEDATAVRFEVVWDIENIVEWYEGPDSTTTDDDIFVLRNNFWEGFSLKAVIERASVEQ